MTLRISPTWLLSLCGVLASAGCAGGVSHGTSGTTLIPAQATGQSTVRHGWFSPMANKEKLTYVSDLTASIILVYQQGQEQNGPIGEIMNGISEPEGIAVDANGTLYVANLGNSTITEYRPGKLDPKVTLSNGISHPLDVSVDSNLTVYVSEGSASSILEFKRGSKSPDQTVSLSHPSGVVNVKSNSLYVTYNESSTGKVGKCRPLAATCKDLGIAVELAQGIAVDLQGNVVVGDALGELINVYAPHQTSPSRTIPTPLEEPSKFALTTNDSVLYFADPANFAVRLYDYKTGTESSNFTFGSADELEGVALSPGQKPGK